MKETALGHLEETLKIRFANRHGVGWGFIEGEPKNWQSYWQAQRENNAFLRSLVEAIRILRKQYERKVTVELEFDEASTEALTQALFLEPSKSINDIIEESLIRFLRDEKLK